MKLKVSMAVLGVLLLFVAPALAQLTNAGDSTYVIKRSGTPIVLTIDVSNITYAFDGNPVNVPFTLKGTGGTVVLAVYTDMGEELQDFSTFKGQGRANAVWRVAGMDTMVYASEGEKFSEGSNTIAWTGRDYHGNTVPAGNYTYYVLAADMDGDPTWMGYNRLDYIDPRSDPPMVYMWSGQTLQTFTFGTDFLANPEAIKDIDVAGALPKDIGISYFHLSPDTPDEFFTTKSSGDGMGAYKGKFNADRTGAEPVSEFGADGYVHGDCGRQYTIQSKYQGWHPFDWPNNDDGLVWMGHQGRGCVPNVSEMWPVDRETGEVGELLDMTDYYTVLRPAWEGEDTSKQYEYTGGPTKADAGHHGIFTTGHNNSRIMHWRYSDHLLMFMNDDGDWYGDKWGGVLPYWVTGDQTAENVRLNYDGRISRYDTGYVVAGGAAYQGEVYGPDGQGLMVINVLNTPWQYSLTTVFVPHEAFPNYAGYYYEGSQMSASQASRYGEGLPPFLFQIPYDVRMAKISTGVTYVEEVEGVGTPAEYALGQNYPNPFNPETTIRFAIPDRGATSVTTVKVYNAAGQLVNTLVNEILGAGEYETVWDGTDASGKLVSSGLYFYMMKSGDFTSSEKMTLLK